jgi:RNA polymerase sigma-70 factor (ECF subfamily)
MNFTSPDSNAGETKVLSSKVLSSMEMLSQIEIPEVQAACSSPEPLYAEAPEPAEAGSPENAPTEAYAGWVELVERIRSGQSDSLEELYLLFSKGIRFYLCRQLGPQELDDKVHDTFVVVVQAIQRGELREPERLMGFVRTIVRRQVAAHIDKVVHSRKEQVELEPGIRLADPRENPEENAIFRQNTELIHRVLSELSERDREILTRFYLDEQSQDQICCEMALTETQFRLLKSRAKARFGELGKKKISQKSLQAVFLRTSAGLFH